MAVNIIRLKQAADRLQTYGKKMEQVDSEKVREEQAKVAKRHRELFVPAAEKFQQLRNTVAAAPVARPALEIVGGVVPEIIQRDNDLRPIRYLQIALLAARSV